MLKSQRKRENGKKSAFGPLLVHEVISQKQEMERLEKSKRRRVASKKRNAEEHLEQKKWVAWARFCNLEFNHQNNGASSKARRIHLHQMGCTAGAADILIFTRLPGAPEARGLALEFKASKGKQSKDQTGWEKRVTSEGWIYHVVRSSNDAKMVCASYGIGR